MTREPFLVTYESTPVARQTHTLCGHGRGGRRFITGRPDSQPRAPAALPAPPPAHAAAPARARTHAAGDDIAAALLDLVDDIAAASDALQTLDKAVCTN